MTRPFDGGSHLGKSRFASRGDGLVERSGDLLANGFELPQQKNFFLIAENRNKKAPIELPRLTHDTRYRRGVIAQLSKQMDGLRGGFELDAPPYASPS